MKVTYRRQVPVPGVQYSAEEVIFEDDISPSATDEWLRNARAAVLRGMSSDWKSNEPEQVRSSGQGPDPDGKPTGEQRRRIRLLLQECAKKNVDVADLEPPTRYGEAEDLLKVLRVRARTGPVGKDKVPPAKQRRVGPAEEDKAGPPKQS